MSDITVQKLQESLKSAVPAVNIVGQVASDEVARRMIQMASASASIVNQRHKKCVEITLSAKEIEKILKKEMYRK